jgi:hypothetical protein
MLAHVVRDHLWSDVEDIVARHEEVRRAVRAPTELAFVRAAGNDMDPTVGGEAFGERCDSFIERTAREVVTSSEPADGAHTRPGRDLADCPEICVVHGGRAYQRDSPPQAWLVPARQSIRGSTVIETVEVTRFGRTPGSLEKDRPLARVAPKVESSRPFARGCVSSSGAIRTTRASCTLCGAHRRELARIMEGRDAYACEGCVFAAIGVLLAKDVPAESIGPSAFHVISLALSGVGPSPPTRFASRTIRAPRPRSLASTPRRAPPRIRWGRS